MNAKVDLKRLRNSIEAAAKSANVVVVQGILVSGKLADVLQVRLEEADFLHALTALKPRVLYVLHQDFNAHDFAQFELSGEGEEAIPESVLADQRIKNLIALWKKHDGEMCDLTSAFVSDSILHTLAESSSWKEEFDNQLSELLGSLAEEDDDQDAEESEEAVQKRKQMAKELADHPKFSAPKSSHAKRCYLAEQLFPDLDSEEIATIVELADNMAWYAKGAD